MSKVLNLISLSFAAKIYNTDVSSIICYFFKKRTDDYLNFKLWWETGEYEYYTLTNLGSFGRFKGQI